MSDSLLATYMLGVTYIMMYAAPFSFFLSSVELKIMMFSDMGNGSRLFLMDIIILQKIPLFSLVNSVEYTFILIS